MSEKEIQKEIDGIRRVTNEAIKSKEAALHLLISAKIIKQPKQLQSTASTKK
ncbi:MAG: hypothetical protein ABIN25_00870 [Ginsengibacter sp.]